MFMVYFVDTHAAKYDTCILIFVHKYYTQTNALVSCRINILCQAVTDLFPTARLIPPANLRHATSKNVTSGWSFAYLTPSPATKPPNELKDTRHPCNHGFASCSSPSGQGGGSSPEASRRFAQQANCCSSRVLDSLVIDHHDIMITDNEDENTKWK